MSFFYEAIHEHFWLFLLEQQTATININKMVDRTGDMGAEKLGIETWFLSRMAQFSEVPSHRSLLTNPGTFRETQFQKKKKKRLHSDEVGQPLIVLKP